MRLDAPEDTIVTTPLILEMRKLTNLPSVETEVWLEVINAGITFMVYNNVRLLVAFVVYEGLTNALQL
jgi:hypothetical protein